MKENNQNNALTETTFLILLSTLNPTHGYEIRQFICDQTNNSLNLGLSTIYNAINSLLEKGLIREFKKTKEESRNKKMVLITDNGKRIIELEQERLLNLYKTSKEILKTTNNNYLEVFMTNKYKVLDLFSGAGGLSYGFYKSGFEIIGAVDNDKDAVETHNLNFKTGESICRNIKEFKKQEIIDKFKKTDLIIGGPPCQGFSSANMWQKDMQDERNKLFFQFIKFVKYLKPKAILIENVQGILTKNDGFAKKKIYEILENQGYNINSKVLLASDYGVPQNRRRAFFIGFRKDLNVKFDFEKIPRKEIVTVAEAISDLYKISNDNDKFTENPKSNYQKLMRINSDDLIHNHQIRYPNKKVRNRMDHVPQGGNWRHVPEKLWDTIRNNRHSSAYRRLKENEPSVTIDTGHMNYFHPLYNRVPTVRESARLQSFPDDFVFLGSKTSQFRQVGNAVPPLISEALAAQIKKCLEV